MSVKTKDDSPMRNADCGVIINPDTELTRKGGLLESTGLQDDHNLGRRSEYIHMVIAIITDSEQELEQISGHLMIVG